jgi:hypothetical protein
VVSLARSRNVRLAVAAGAAALLVAGCSASAGANSGSNNAGSTGTTTATLTAAEAVNLAAAHAQKATSFTGTISVQSAGAGLDGMTIAGTMSETTSPSLLVEADLPTVNVSGMPFSGGMSEILTSSSIYMKMSALSSLLGKPWAEVQLSDLKVGGVSFGQVMQQVQGDSPLTQTQLLAHASHVRKVGTGTLGGVPVTEYSGSYSMQAALAQVHGFSTTQLRQQLASYGFTTADFQVWLDNQQQARKLIVTELGSKGSITSTMTVTSINQPVNVQLPSTSQVAVIPASMLKAGSALQSGS